MTSYAYYAGFHSLPDLEDRELQALENEQYHKVRNSAHVQAMEVLINESHSVPPTEINGAVLCYDGPGQVRGVTSQAYVVLGEDDDGDPYFKATYFLGTMITHDVVARLTGMTKNQLLAERFEHVPPRAALVG